MIAVKIPLIKKGVSAFALFSTIGVVTAMIQSGILLHFLSLSWWLLPVMFVTSSLAFLLVAMLIKVLIGKEDHVMLRYFIAVMLFNYFVIRWIDEPLFPYLDILALGYGTIIFLGRFGCYMVGCCHGRPNSFGVCYTHEHVRKGFPDYYSGVRLFPLQVAEAFGLLIILCINVSVLVTGHEQGMVLSIFVTLYGLLRFVLEFFRGDPERRYFISFSEAQWTILLLIVFLSLAEQMGIMPVADWQMSIHGILVLAFFSFSVARFIRPQLRINEPMHVKALLNFKLGKLTQPVKVHTTSLGINISGCRANGETQYTLSANKFKLNYSTVKKLGRILSIRHPHLSPEIHSQRPEVFSVIFRSKSE